MRSLEDGRSRPAGNGPATKSLTHNTTILIQTIDVQTYLEAGFVLLVAVTSIRKGTTRRRVYFNLPSATTAVRQAELRGDVAHTVLAKLFPVGDVR